MRPPVAVDRPGAFFSPRSSGYSQSLMGEMRKIAASPGFGRPLPLTPPHQKEEGEGACRMQNAESQHLPNQIPAPVGRHSTPLLLCELSLCGLDDGARSWWYKDGGPRVDG